MIVGQLDRDKHMYIILSVTWFEVLDHVKLTGMDHQIKQDMKHQVWSSDPRLSAKRDLTFAIKLLLS